MSQTLQGEQLTREQAIEFGESDRWEPMSDEERARFGLTQRFLPIPFKVFHEAITKALGRDVWTHEFARMDLLLDELDRHRMPPTWDEIAGLIPAEKRIVIDPGGPS